MSLLWLPSASTFAPPQFVLFSQILYEQLYKGKTSWKTKNGGKTWQTAPPGGTKKRKGNKKNKWRKGTRQENQFLVFSWWRWWFRLLICYKNGQKLKLVAILDKIIKFHCQVFEIYILILAKNTPGKYTQKERYWTSYYISLIEIGQLWAKIKHLKCHLKFLGFALQIYMK